MDVEKNQKATPTQFLQQEETAKKINEKYSNTGQKSEQRESFRKQTEVLKEGLKKLKELQKEETNDKEIIKNQEQEKNKSRKKQMALEVFSAVPEVTTIIITITNNFVRIN